jgi:hypothetical protein
MEIEGYIGARVVVVIEPAGYSVPYENWEEFQNECHRLPYVTEVAGPEINGAWAITFKDAPKSFPDEMIIRWCKKALLKHLKQNETGE